MVDKGDHKVFIVLPGADAPPCPCCGGSLHYRDSRARIRKREGGGKETLIIRRLQCSVCDRLHNELPDCLTPYKHYGTDVISGVLDGVITPDDDDSEDYPCVQTMRRWFAWLNRNSANVEGSIRRAGHAILGLGEEILSLTGSVLSVLRERYPDWLERALRIIYNSGGGLASAT